MSEGAARAFEHPNGRGVCDRFALAWGKLRRLYMTTLRPRKARRMLERRRGECLRCGVCCKLVVKCPHLDESGLPACTVHEQRHRNCRAFPLDERDLRDRDRVSPGTKCGYWFVNGEQT